MKKPIILVTGKNGQLGSELQQLAHRFTQYEFAFTDVKELDISNEELVSRFFGENKPFACINTAAYTAVDKAETDRNLALKINGEAVGILAANCKKFNTRFIHISTDYVFDGTGSKPYLEDDAISPVNFYGESKLKGETEAFDKHEKSIVIRTSWVYSYYGNNFVKTMLRLMNERDSINVINDQFGSPTYAADLAEAILQIVVKEQVQPGIYHYSNAGIISWYDFAVAIREMAGLQCEIKGIDTSGYPTPAKRPAYSVMSKEKIKSLLGIELKDWKDSLQQCISLLQKEATVQQS